MSALIDQSGETECCGCPSSRVERYTMKPLPNFRSLPAFTNAPLCAMCVARAQHNRMIWLGTWRISPTIGQPFLVVEVST